MFHFSYIKNSIWAYLCQVHNPAQVKIIPGRNGLAGDNSLM
jgi:hypothetical protein